MNDKARQALRDSLRQARRGLRPEQQAEAARRLHERAGAQDFSARLPISLFYQSADGEIDPAPLLDTALAAGKNCYLPVIPDNEPEQMVFARYDRATELVENRWGIKQPPLSGGTVDLVDPTALDLVFVPLVGFDRRCFRLGMGRGCYDRAFSFRIGAPGVRPLLVGLAHECQLTATVPAADWDVQLDAVISPEKIYRPDTP